MNFFQPKNIFDSSSLFCFLQKFCGFLFFTKFKEPSGQIILRTSKFDVLWFIFSLVSFSWMCYNAFQMPTAIPLKSVVLEVGSLINIKVILAHSIIVVLLNFLNRRKFMQILQNLFLIDGKV